jgi:hypothetical protein
MTMKKQEFAIYHRTQVGMIYQQYNLISSSSTRTRASATNGRASCWTGSASCNRPRNSLPNFPAANSSASASPAPSSTIPRSSWRTSRWVTSIRPRPRTCSTSWRT